ncbi:universal stress protein [Aquicoccus porphyridii]|uniref:Universal stress protein n=1 Tax=Aquicoccus porphyridii TaxID=1852029 RepID=A0A5A9ZKA9_9RHOB|nr:universal stress protein [Aquicoccus porphyridii]KAA0917489.1 universal stress protein [Aquicoccus porphyridii]RAI55574.1 universal stress protein [Rhodobacteraceae bacterium AsT-22]
MAYKSLFSVLTDPKLIENTLAHAIAMADSVDAHLDVLCLGVDRSQTGYYYAGANAMVLQETIDRAQEDAKSIEEQARDILGRSSIRWGSDTGVAQLADIGRHVAAHARFSDLVIQPLPYGEDRGAELEPVVESAMFEGQTPVLVVPDEGEPKPAPKTVMIGWNESAEALNAVRAALPVLEAAEAVHVVVIDPPTHGPNRSDPGGLLSQYLSRHGVRAEVDVLSKTLPRVSDVLMRHATDIDADMIVMGAYGHSRFREAILGGATRYMLEQAKLPVFMAH